MSRLKILTESPCCRIHSLRGNPDFLKGEGLTTMAKATGLESLAKHCGAIFDLFVVPVLVGRSRQGSHVRFLRKPVRREPIVLSGCWAELGKRLSLWLVLVNEIWPVCQRLGISHAVQNSCVEKRLVKNGRIPRSAHHLFPFLRDPNKGTWVGSGEDENQTD